jgi:chitodextrinase
MTKYITHALVLMTAAAAAGCTLGDSAPPPLAGPSEMSLSLSITANPETLSLDGSSQALITVDARDTNGMPKANVPFRVEILADGQIVDFGSISARTLTTNSTGRSSFTYTAPSFVAGPIPNVQLSVTPTGSEVGFDASAQLRRVVTIRLVPPGFIGGAPTARFTFSPASPAAFSDVRFDGSTSTAGLGAIITSWTWDFGDNSSGSGEIATHRYTAPGTYQARLTVTDSNGISNSSEFQAVVVGGAYRQFPVQSGKPRPRADDLLQRQHVDARAGPYDRPLRLGFWRWDATIGLIDIEGVQRSGAVHRDSDGDRRGGPDKPEDRHRERDPVAGDSVVHLLANEPGRWHADHLQWQ